MPLIDTTNHTVMAFRKIAAIVFVRQMLIQSLVGNFVMVAELLYEKIAIK